MGTNEPAAISRSSIPAPHACSPCTHTKSEGTARPLLIASATASPVVRNTPESPIGSPGSSRLRWSQRIALSRSASLPPKSTCRFRPLAGNMTCAPEMRLRITPTEPERPERSTSTSALCMNCALSVNSATHGAERSTVPTRTETAESAPPGVDATAATVHAVSALVGASGRRFTRTHSRSIRSENPPADESTSLEPSPMPRLRRAHVPIPQSSASTAPSASASAAPAASAARRWPISSRSSTPLSAETSRQLEPVGRSSSSCSWPGPHPAYPTNAQKSDLLASPCATSARAQSRLV
mmetsp:Transcript_12672/g.39885  ORF Transcript_12672/g.39885 Transcript_12672/m.39885 type:complete len:297 (-) Transcript_12672:650-1540(-)